MTEPELERVPLELGPPVGERDRAVIRSMRCASTMNSWHQEKMPAPGRTVSVAAELTPYAVTKQLAHGGEAPALANLDLIPTTLAGVFVKLIPVLTTFW